MSRKRSKAYSDTPTIPALMKVDTGHDYDSEIEDLCRELKLETKRYRPRWPYHNNNGNRDYADDNYYDDYEYDPAIRSRFQQHNFYPPRVGGDPWSPREWVWNGRGAPRPPKPYQPPQNNRGRGAAKSQISPHYSNANPSVTPIAKGSVQNSPSTPGGSSSNKYPTPNQKTTIKPADKSSGPSSSIAKASVTAGPAVKEAVQNKPATPGNANAKRDSNSQNLAANPKASGSISQKTLESRSTPKDSSDKPNLTASPQSLANSKTVLKVNEKSSVQSPSPQGTSAKPSVTASHIVKESAQNKTTTPGDSNTKSDPGNSNIIKPEDAKIKGVNSDSAVEIPGNSQHGSSTSQVAITDKKENLVKTNDSAPTKSTTVSTTSAKNQIISKSNVITSSKVPLARELQKNTPQSQASPVNHSLIKVPLISGSPESSNIKGHRVMLVFSNAIYETLRAQYTDNHEFMVGITAEIKRYSKDLNTPWTITGEVAVQGFKTAIIVEVPESTARKMLQVKKRRFNNPKLFWIDVHFQAATDSFSTSAGVSPKTVMISPAVPNTPKASVSVVKTEKKPNSPSIPASQPTVASVAKPGLATASKTPTPTSAQLATKNSVKVDNQTKTTASSILVTTVTVTSKPTTTLCTSTLTKTVSTVANSLKTAIKANVSNTTSPRSSPTPTVTKIVEKNLKEAVAKECTVATGVQSTPKAATTIVKTDSSNQATATPVASKPVADSSPGSVKASTQPVSIVSQPKISLPTVVKRGMECVNNKVETPSTMPSTIPKTAPPSQQATVTPKPSVDLRDMKTVIQEKVSSDPKIEPSRDLNISKSVGEKKYASTSAASNSKTAASIDKTTTPNQTESVTPVVSTKGTILAVNLTKISVTSEVKPTIDQMSSDTAVRKPSAFQDCGKNISIPGKDVGISQKSRGAESSVVGPNDSKQSAPLAGTNKSAIQKSSTTSAAQTSVNVFLPKKNESAVTPTNIVQEAPKTVNDSSKGVTPVAKSETPSKSEVASNIPKSAIKLKLLQKDNVPSDDDSNSKTAAGEKVSSDNTGSCQEKKAVASITPTTPTETKSKSAIFSRLGPASCSVPTLPSVSSDAGSKTVPWHRLRVWIYKGWIPKNMKIRQQTFTNLLKRVGFDVLSWYTIEFSILKDKVVLVVDVNEETFKLVEKKGMKCEVQFSSTQGATMYFDVVKKDNSTAGPTISPPVASDSSSATNLPAIQKQVTVSAPGTEESPRSPSPPAATDLANEPSRTFYSKKEKKVYFLADIAAIRKMDEAKGSKVNSDEVVKLIVSYNIELAKLSSKVVDFRRSAAKACLVAFLDEDEAEQVSGKPFWFKAGSGYFKLSVVIPTVVKRPPPNVQPWEWTGHKMCFWTDNEAIHKLCQPKGGTISSYDVIQAIADANDDLDTTQWKVVYFRRGDIYTTIFVVVDKESCEATSVPYASFWVKTVDQQFKVHFSTVSKDDVAENTEETYNIKEEVDVLGEFPKGRPETPVTIETYLLHRGFPKVKLTRRESKKLGLAILELQPPQCSFQFLGMHYRPGFLKVSCYGERSRRWLEDALEDIEHDVGFPLELADQKEIVLNLWFPKKSLVSPSMSNAQILLRLLEDNPTLKACDMTLANLIRGEKITLLLTANLDAVYALAKIDFFGKFNQGDVYFRTSCITVVNGVPIFAE